MLYLPQMIVPRAITKRLRGGDRQMIVPYRDQQLRAGFQLPRLQTNHREQDHLHVGRRNAAPSSLTPELALTLCNVLDRARIPVKDHVVWELS